MADHTVNVGVVVDVKGEEKLDALGKKVQSVSKQSSSAQIDAADAASSTIKGAAAAEAASKTAAASSIKHVTAAKALSKAEADAIRARRMGIGATPAEQKQNALQAFLEGRDRLAQTVASRNANIPLDQARKNVGLDAAGKFVGGAQAGGSFAKATASNAAAAAASKAANSIKEVTQEVSSGFSLVGVRMLATSAGSLALAGALGVATVAFGAMGATLLLMKKSITWAEEAADKTIDTFDRMFKHRTTWQQETERFQAGTDLLGKGFEKLNDKIKDKKFFESDFAQNWGITPGALKREAAKRGAAPGRTAAPDSLDILEAAVTKREDLQRRYDDALKKDPAAKGRNIKDIMRKQRLFAENVEDLGDDFAKAARTLSSDDIKVIKANAAQIADMTAKPENTRNAIMFKAAMSQLDNTFTAMKFNIGTAVMPAITDAMKNMSTAVQQAQPAITRVTSAITTKGFEALSVVFERLTGSVAGSTLGETLNNIATAIENTSKEDIADKIESIGSALVAFGQAIMTIAEAISTAREKLGLVTPDKAKESIQDRFSKFGFKGPPVDLAERPTPFTGVPMPRPRPDTKTLEEEAKKARESLEGGAEKAAQAVTDGGSGGGKNFADAVMGIPWTQFGLQIAGQIAKALQTPVNINMSGGPSTSNGRDAPVAPGPGAVYGP